MLVDWSFTPGKRHKEATRLVSSVPIRQRTWPWYDYGWNQWKTPPRGTLRRVYDYRAPTSCNWPSGGGGRGKPSASHYITEGAPPSSSRDPLHPTTYSPTPSDTFPYFRILHTPSSYFNFSTICIKNRKQIWRPTHTRLIYSYDI